MASRGFAFSLSVIGPSLMPPCDCVPPGCMPDGHAPIVIGLCSSIGAKMGHIVFS